MPSALRGVLSHLQFNSKLLRRPPIEMALVVMRARDLALLVLFCLRERVSCSPVLARPHQSSDVWGEILEAAGRL